MKTPHLIPLAALLLALGSTPAHADVSGLTASGWFESGYATWTKADGYTYHVYVRSTADADWTRLDDELVREYPTYGRADAVGLRAGDYTFRVVPVLDGVEQPDQAAESAPFAAVAHDRAGFAHFRTASATFDPSAGIGAYTNDGTLKAGAKVFYVTAETAKTITTTVKTGAKDTNLTECVGLQTIIDAYQKGYDTTPIAFRIVGTISAADMDHFSSSAEGLQIKGRNAYSELNITLEGIGNDATLHGFGLLLRNACSVELRNFAVMWCMDDAVSIDTDNSNLWVHHLDLFYGQPGGAADQKKGDGTLDIKGDSRYTTLAYNHLWDSGKASLCGMTSETGPNYLTYHHNWFDHSDSRHPRIRTMSVHVYNNYYDGNAKYGVGVTSGADAFVEANYFRSCKYPMLSSKQGSDVHNGTGSSDETKGTFSGEPGGSIKAFGNIMTGHKSFEPYQEGHPTYATHFDAYVASERNEQVPATVTALLGGDTYSNFDTDPALMYADYAVQPAADVPATVTGPLGAGRCQHGDFQWTFGAGDDDSDAVIPALSDAIRAYRSSLIGIFGAERSGDGGSEGEGGNTDPNPDPDPDGPDTPGQEDGTWTTAYQYIVTGPVPAAVVAGNAQNYSDPIPTTGGTFTFGNVSKIESSAVAATGYAVKLDGDAGATSTKYALVQLDAPLAAGDRIALSGYCTSNPNENNRYGISLYAEPDGAPLASVDLAAKNVEEVHTLDVPQALVGKTAFYLFRNPAKSVYLTAVRIAAPTTGLDSTPAHPAVPAAGPCFDLSGRPIAAPAPGVPYIQGGRISVAR